MADITLEDLQKALVNADQAGDVTSARLLAAEINKISKAQQPKEGGIGEGIIKRVTQAGQGLKGAGLRAGELVGLVEPETLAQYEQGVKAERSVMSPTYQSMTPTGTGENVGSALVDIVGSMGAGGLLKKAGQKSLGGMFLPETIPQAGAASALYSLTTPSESTSEMLAKAGIGTGVGGASQFFLRQLGLAPMPESGITEQQKIVAQRALKEKFNIDPTQLTGYGAGVKEGIKSNLPFARGAFTRLEEGNQTKTNDIARNLIKLPPNTPLTNENMRFAYTEALNKYKTLNNVPAVLGDSQFVNAIDAQINKIKGLKPSELTADDKRALRILSDYKDFSSKGMSGEQAFNSLKSIGDNLFQAKKNASGPAIESLTTLRSAFEDSIERYLNSPANLMRQNGTQTLDKFREGRADMSNWFLVNKAFNNETGNISAAKLSRELSKNPKYGTTGTPVETAAMLSGAFPRAYPSSGTAERLSHGDIYKSTSGLIASPLTYLATSAPVRNIMAQKYVGAAPEGLIGKSYGLVAGAGKYLPEEARNAFGRALMAAEQQQLNQQLAPSQFGLLGQ
jgi:hypothetical protein